MAAVWLVTNESVRRVAQVLSYAGTRQPFGGITDIRQNNIAQGTRTRSKQLPINTFHHARIVFVTVLNPPPLNIPKYHRPHIRSHVPPRCVFGPVRPTDGHNWRHAQASGPTLVQDTAPVVPVATRCLCLGGPSSCLRLTSYIVSC